MDQRRAAQEHRQLRRVDRCGLALRGDYFERSRFEKFVMEPIAGTVEVEDLQPVAPAVHEEEKAAVQRIGASSLRTMPDNASNPVRMSVG